MRDLHLEPGMAFKRAVNLAKQRKGAARCGLALLATCVFAGGAAVQAGPHDAFGGLMGVVSQARSGAVDTESEEKIRLGPAPLQAAVTSAKLSLWFSKAARCAISRG